MFDWSRVRWALIIGGAIILIMIAAPLAFRIDGSSWRPAEVPITTTTEVPRAAADDFAEKLNAFRSTAPPPTDGTDGASSDPSGGGSPANGASSDPASGGSAADRDPATGPAAGGSPTDNAGSSSGAGGTTESASNRPAGTTLRYRPLAPPVPPEVCADWTEFFSAMIVPDSVGSSTPAAREAAAREQVRHALIDRAELIDRLRAATPPDGQQEFDQMLELGRRWAITGDGARQAEAQMYDFFNRYVGGCFPPEPDAAKPT